MEVLPAIVESMQSVYFPAYIATLGSVCVFTSVGVQGSFCCHIPSFYGPFCENGSEDKVAC